MECILSVNVINCSFVNSFKKSLTQYISNLFCKHCEITLFFLVILLRLHLFVIRLGGKLKKPIKTNFSFRK